MKCQGSGFSLHLPYICSCRVARTRLSSEDHSESYNIQQAQAEAWEIPAGICTVTKPGRSCWKCAYISFFLPCTPRWLADMQVRCSEVNHALQINCILILLFVATASKSSPTLKTSIWCSGVWICCTRVCPSGPSQGGCTFRAVAEDGCGTHRLPPASPTEGTCGERRASPAGSQSNVRLIPCPKSWPAEREPGTHRGVA